ncbi:hypothetical protein, partial [Cupriavidus pinatubonensis]|uniref:hypothetical protein n=1 Tax=Cupriavidus pinatubonensis TaxID=248026 RepID=UPI001C62D529
MLIEGPLPSASWVLSGLICHSPGTVDAGKRDTRYELTARALDLSGESRLLSQQAPADANFDSLLGAWEIKLPLMPADLHSLSDPAYWA